MNRHFKAGLITLAFLCFATLVGLSLHYVRVHYPQEGARASVIVVIIIMVATIYKFTLKQLNDE